MGERYFVFLPVYRKVGMTDNISKLEALLNKKVVSWTMNDIVIICSKQEALKMLDPLTVDHILEQDNKLIFPAFFPIQINNHLKQAQDEVKKAIDDYDDLGDKKAFIAKMDEMKVSPDFVFQLVSYLTILNEVEGYDLKPDEDKLRKLISTSLENIYKVDMDAGMMIICNILDIIYPIQEKYFNLYKVDLISDPTERETLNKFSDALDQHMKPVFDQLQNELVEEVKKSNIKPEDMGLIDITKLKGGE